MGKLKKILYSKKVIVTLIGLFAALLSQVGFDLTPEAQDALLKLIIALVGSFNIGQGLADGLSRGKTSAQTNGLDVDDVADIISKFGLKVITPRNKKGED